MSSFIEKLQRKSERDLEVFEKSLIEKSNSELEPLKEELENIKFKYEKLANKAKSTKDSREKMKYKRDVEFKVDSEVRKQMLELYKMTLDEYVNNHSDFYINLINQKLTKIDEILSIKYSEEFKEVAIKNSKNTDLISNSTTKGIIVETDCSTIDLSLDSIQDDIYAQLNAEIYQLIKDQIDE
jgi:hypothetical protein